MQLIRGDTIGYLGYLLHQLPRTVKIGGVLLGLLGLTVLIGLLGGSGRILPMLALVALPFMAVSFGASVRYFDTLVLVLPLTALLLRFIELPTGTESTLPASLVLTLGLVAIWGLTMIVRREWQVPASPFTWPLLIFMLICIISLPWGILWRDPILNMRVMGGNFIFTQIGSLVTMISLMCIPFLVGRFIDQAWKIKFYLVCFIVCGILMTVTQFFSIRQNILNDRGSCGLWSVVSLFVILTTQQLRWYWRLLIITLIVWHLYVMMILNSSWLSGWVPTILAIAIILWMRSRLIFTILIAVTISFTFFGSIRPQIEQMIAEEIDEGGLERFAIWERNFGVIFDHWFLGTGPAGYSPYNMTYFPWDARSTHNNHMDILAQFGFVGMAVWIWFTVASVRYGWRVMSNAPEGLLRITAMTSLSGWIAAQFSMIFGDWMLPFAYNQGITGFSYIVYNWIFLGLIISVDRVSQHAKPVAQQHSEIVRQG
ncbi:O-antigen ligase family protein [Candidatus Chloroploca sp. M-50]|uniref:O-antigen ligase family protein n=1 Tax=Candidatus Chloroploca mongolica TaxID=2528176 RepID=A0ABS4D628_9CHLR|nr:O-antigen ligase family protein [Candidatus Chloroploca mongolica]MBP1464883.1 O-antigen ligase family protein [Candidatus Chloroploca mongolica]